MSALTNQASTSFEDEVGFMQQSTLFSPATSTSSTTTTTQTKNPPEASSGTNFMSRRPEIVAFPDSKSPTSPTTAWTNPTSDEIAQNFFLCYHHDELSAHGRIQTYQFKCCAHPTKIFDKNLTGKMFQAPINTLSSTSSQLQHQQQSSSSWIDPTRNRLNAFIKKIGESVKSPKMKKVVDKACFCDRYCKEYEDRDKDAENTRELYYFFCGPVVYEIECLVVVLAIPTWKFETDHKTMNPLSKLDAVKLERLYQEHGCRGSTPAVLCAYNRTYVYDFDSMNQINVATKKKRRIERSISGDHVTVPPFNNGSMKSWLETVGGKVKSLSQIPFFAGMSDDQNQQQQQQQQQQSSQRNLNTDDRPATSSTLKRDLKNNNNNNNNNHDTAHYRELLGKAELEGAQVDQKRAQVLAAEENRQKKLIEEKLAAKKQSFNSSNNKNQHNPAHSSINQQPPVSNAPQQQPNVPSPSLASSIVSASSSSSTPSSTNSLPKWLSDLEHPEKGNVPHDIITILHDQRLDETTFLLLTGSDLAALGIPLGPRLALLKIVNERNQQQQQVGPSSPILRPGTSPLSGNNNNNNNNNAASSSNAQIAPASASIPSCSSSDPKIEELMRTLHERFHRTIVIDPSDVELFSIIASGGFGSVYMARIGGIKPAACKMFESFKDGLAEAEICHKLFHKNIVSLIGVSVYCPRRAMAAMNNNNSNSDQNSSTSSSAMFGQPKFLLLMELADEPLSAILTQRASTLDWEIVERFALQIAQGLAYLHQNGVLHLDIKPQNILCLHNNSVLKLTDFGVSKHKRSAESTSTMVSRVAGSMCFMPPEQRTSLSVSARNDVYSFGVVLFWMITGVPPVEIIAASNQFAMNPEDSPKYLLQALEDGAIRSGCREVLSTLCRRCIQKDPKDRLADGSEILKILQEGLCDTTELVRGVSSKSSGGGDDRNNENNHSNRSRNEADYSPPTRTEVIGNAGQIYEFD